MAIIQEDFVQNLEKDKLLIEFSKVLKKPDIRSLMLMLPMGNIKNCIEMFENQVEILEFAETQETHTFDWSNEKYLKRIAENEIYKNVLQWTDKRYLDILKFSFDLKQVKTFVDDIFKSTKDALFHLKDCHRALQMQEHLVKKLEQNKEKWERKSEDMEQLFDNNKKQQMITDDNYNNAIDIAMDDLLIDPIKMRFRINTVRVEHAEFKESLEAAASKLEREIIDVTEKLNRATQVHEKTMELFIVEKEGLHDQIAFWTSKFQYDYDKYSSKTIELHLNIQAMENHYESLKERIEYFRYELTHLKEIAKPMTEKERQRIIDFFGRKRKAKQKKSPQNVSMTKKMGKAAKAS